MNLTTLLTFATLTASAQVTLTPIQVRTVHAIIDSEARLREQAALDSADLADYAIALRHCETLRVKAEADAADLRLLAGVHYNRAEKMNAALVSQARKTRARSVVAWVLAGVAVVEGVIIGVAVGTR